jgi:citrate synthase
MSILINSINMKTTWLSSTEALALLPVRQQTLYANVSRGRIRTRPDARDPRRSLYHRADVERLAEQARGRRSSARVAANAIHWGEPVLSSSVSSVSQGVLRYRGQDATALADAATLEDIAALLWRCPVVSLDAPAMRTPRAIGASADPASPLATALHLLARRVATDPPSSRRASTVLQAEAVGLVGALATSLIGQPGRGALHERLAQAWGKPRSADLLRRALVLLADHELNVSTFAVRVTISSGASLAAGLLSGLAALTGPLHGGAGARVLALARDARRMGAEAALQEWLAHDRPLSAFGHPLYPQGDPRCAALLAQLREPPVFAQLRVAGERLVGEPPNIDFALAALTQAHGLPPQAPLLIFALARSVGWVAHALEQQAAGTLIRPRASGA